MSDEHAKVLAALNRAFLDAYLVADSHVIDDLQRRVQEYVAAVAAQARREALDSAYERIGIALRALAGEAEPKAAPPETGRRLKEKSSQLAPSGQPAEKQGG